jgi:hypothetical protein
VIEEINSAGAGETDADATPALTLATANRRARAAVALLRGRGYVPLVKIGGGDTLSARLGTDEVDVDGETVIVRDAKSGWTRLQATFPVAPPEADEVESCVPHVAGEHQLYTTELGDALISAVSYRAGHCWCDDETLLYARPLAAVPANLGARR